MKFGKKVIIIGGGSWGGLTTAIRLLSRGYEVEIYEKEERVGGKVNIIEITETLKDISRF